MSGQQSTLSTDRPRIRERAATGRRRAALAAGAGLGSAAAVHAAWALGSTWPAADRGDLADLVVGTTEFPSNPATWGVTALLGSATMVVLGRADLLGPIGRRIPRRLLVWGATTVAAVLLLRGAFGVVDSGLVIAHRAGRFHLWDARLYSPLCLLLGALTAVVARSEQSEAAGS